MRALVTGSGGFLGRHFSEELETRSWDVTGWELADGHDAMSLFSLNRIISFDLVIHCAAQSPHRAAIDGQPASHIRNRMLDAAMFDWAIRAQAGRVLYLSSCAVLDDTPDDYGLAKLAGERMAGLARRAGIPVSVVRPYSGYGEDQSEDFPFGAFAARARRREDPFSIWGDGTQTRDWIHVDDLVGAALAVVDSGTEKPVSLCTGVGTPMFVLALRLCEEAGYKPKLGLNYFAPVGMPYRVGDPTQMLQYYTPRVDLAAGIKRALA